MNKLQVFSGFVVVAGLFFASAANASWFGTGKPTTPENWPGPGLYRYDIEATATVTHVGISTQMHTKRDGETGIESQWHDGQPPLSNKSEPLHLCIKTASPEMLASASKLSNQCQATLERPGKEYDEYAFDCPDGISMTMIAKRTGPNSWEISDETRIDRQGAIAGGGMVDMRQSIEAATANLPPEERKKILAQLPSEAEARAQDKKLQAEIKKEMEMLETKMADATPQQKAAMNNMRGSAGPLTVTKTVWRYTKIDDTCSTTR